MTTPPPALPGVKSLYWNDLAFRRGANLLGFGLVVAVGIWWVTRPIEGVPPTVDRSFEVMVRPWAIAGGIALAAAGGLLLLWRWRLVGRLFREGERITAVIEDLEAVKWTSDKNEVTGRSTHRHSYYATLRYVAGGAERVVEVKLPNSGFTFGLAKGRETEVLVLESAPKRPLILAVISK